MLTHLEKGIAGDLEETPKPGDPRLARVETIMVATPKRSLEAAADVARKHGLDVMMLGDNLEGEARALGAAHARQAMELARRGGKPTVILSGGSDTLSLALVQQVKSTFTLGAGADTFKLLPYTTGNNATWSNLHVTGATIDAYATITDFAKGVDHIDLGTSYPLTSGLNAFVGGATTLEQAMTNVSPHLAANATGVFDLGGDTYLSHPNATVGVDTGDGLIRLVGVTGLSIATGSATGDIHYG